MALFNYFRQPFTAENLRTQYKELAKKLHPDAGGTDAEFQKMQEEFERAVKFAARARKVRRGKVARKKQAPFKIELTPKEKEFISEMREFAVDALRGLIISKFQ